MPLPVLDSEMLLTLEMQCPMDNASPFASRIYKYSVPLCTRSTMNLDARHPTPPSHSTTATHTNVVLP